MKDIPLHDIKPLVEVPDNSFIYLLILACLLLIALVLLLLWAYKAYKKSRVVTLRKSYLEKIHAIDTNNVKEAAYQITLYGQFLVRSEEERQLLEELDRQLQAYKYKKEVSSSIDEETLKAYQLFLEAVDAS